jgi:hypothetical protein
MSTHEIQLSDAVESLLDEQLPPGVSKGEWMEAQLETLVAQNHAQMKQQELQQGAQRDGQMEQLTETVTESVMNELEEAD